MPNDALADRLHLEGRYYDQARSEWITYGVSRTLVTFGLNIVVELPYGLELPIDLRASYNPMQPSKWEDRATLTMNGQPAKLGQTINGLTLRYENSWDIRLLLGLGYEF